MTQSGAKDDAQLRPLREDLRLFPGPLSESGAPAWLIYDPAQHRYFQIDQRTRDLLDHWPQSATVKDLTERASQMFAVSGPEVEKLVAFVDEHNLTVEPRNGGAARLWSQRQRGHLGFIKGLLHNYLFFRVPLLRPDRALRATLPLVEPVFSRTMAIAVMVCGLSGLYLASRQWDTFVAAVSGFLSWEGLACFSVGLFFVKALHELGHAYTAVRFGCVVPSMGIAVMMLAPMLYTDVTDAWRLTSRRQRIAVASAGLVVELGLACVASLAWALLSDGALRSIALVVATTSWVISLAMNLNPLMRFDGYYILSDALRLENLLDRSFAFGRWKLRELLFDLREPAPETVSNRDRRLMIGYAWSVWIYRLILFTGIALLVYHFFFKALGIILFLVEIVYFIAWPIWVECAEWVKRRQRISATRRSGISMVSGVALLVLFVVPWSSRVEVPAVLDYQDLAHIYPLRSASVAAVKVTRGDRVEKDAMLVELVSHEIESEIRFTTINLSLVELRRARLAVDTVDREQTLVLDRQKLSLASKLSGLEAEKRQLSVRAPMSGVVLELDAAIASGGSIGHRDEIALIGNTAVLEVRGYAAELDMPRIPVGTKGWFIPEDPTEPSHEVTVVQIDSAGANHIDIEALADTQGGPVAVSAGTGHELTPAGANYAIRLRADPPARPPVRSLRGLAVLDGLRESMAERLWRRAMGILVRESGF